jgi:hypothetical protein
MKNVYFLSSRRLGLAWVLAGLAAVLPLQALSQAYPTKPVKVLVGFTAGGAVDLIARSVGQVMSAGLGQPVVVERPPAGWTGTPAPASPASRLPPARCRRALPRLRPGGPSSPTRPSASTRPATPARRSSSRCATTWASRATSSCRPPATAPTTAPWSMPVAFQRRQGARRGHGEAQRHRRRTAGNCTPPACAACASTSSSAWSTSRPRTS